MQWLHCRFGPKALLFLCLAIAFGAASRAGSVSAAEQQYNLQLDVVINGAPAHIIGSFILFPGGVIGATRSELESLGLRMDGVPGSADIVMLHDIPTLHYVYEERTQTIRITLDEAYRRPRVLDLRGGADARLASAATAMGMVLNYQFYGSASSQSQAGLLGYNGSSLTLDARAFSSWGTVSQSGILTSVVNGNPEMVRLDTAYRYSDPDAVICYTAGDAINGGLAWTRPIRMGGLQGQRDFALRPDLVTMPLPNLGGTAAVPSTVDVYVNNARTFSQEIDAGPFLLTNIPMVTGAGNAQVVLRDSSGQATMTNIPFYGSPALLAPGLSSWSVEAGLPRLFYGSIDDTYAATPVASLTWRQGVFDSFTAEAHAEGGSGVANGGVGGVVRTGTMGVAAGAVAASRLGTGHGIQVAGSYEMSLGRLMFNVSSQRTFGDYEDLASASARLQATTSASPATSSGASPLNLDLYNSTRPPLALDRVMVGGPLAFDPASSWNASVIHEHDASDNVSDLASFSYARSLPFNVSLFATVYKNVGGGSNLGMIFGLTMPLGPSVSVSSSVSTVPGGAVGTLEASHSLGPEPGSVGWQMQDSEGAVPYRQAAVSYRSTYLTVQAGGYQSPLASGGNVGADGSIAIMGGDVFFSNRINDAFAVVDAGAPNVEVFYENQPVGTTDAHGMFLVPTLRSYQSNRISIDPAGLPVDAEMETTREIVTPADRAGALVAFKLHNDTMAALVILVRPDGSFVPVGSRGRAAGGEEFVVGYDGQAFIKHLSAANTLDVDLDDKTCHAAFNFQPQPGKQVRIGPVTCG